MTSQNNNTEEMRRREQELRDRETALRLRELEMEISQPPIPVYPTTKHEAPPSKLKQRLRQATNVAKFLGIVVAVIVAVKVAMWAATALMVGAIAWIAYKIFFDDKKRTP